MVLGDPSVQAVQSSTTSELTSAVAAAFRFVASIARLCEPLALGLRARRVLHVDVHGSEKRLGQTALSDGETTQIYNLAP